MPGMARVVRWSLIAFIIAVVGVAPLIWYRALYVHSKRLRIVVPGKVYRSGQMTVDGFEDAVKQLGIRTVINFQDDYPDPNLEQSYFNRAVTPESEVCRRLGVHYVFIAPDLVPRRQLGERRPEAIDKLLSVLDEPANYPVLLHCRAGLHRTGCMAAVYRMEYQGWTPEQAVEEMKAHGFASKDCTAANDYVYQYVLTYRPGLRLKQVLINNDH
jgi:protein tyrosine phosphatase (PTP) superfamily phosphohydrolase (DUF442 family)